MRDKVRGIFNFFRNIWLFRKSLYRFKWWDYSFMLTFMKENLDVMSEKFEKYGLEEKVSKAKKVEKMKRASFLLNNFIEENFLFQAEDELGELIHRKFEFESVPDKPGFMQLIDNQPTDEKEYNKKIFDRAREIEEEQWAELWEIFKGTDKPKYDHKKDNWGDWYDGTGIRNWWD